MSEGRPIRVRASLDKPFDQVRTALLRDAPGIFRRATTVAHERAGQVVASLRVNVAGIDIGKEIDIQLIGSSDTEGPCGVPSATRIELQWCAVGHPALFPTMRAELVVHALSAEQTQLGLSGSYTPPLGPLGVVLDAVAGHRLAEASVQQFVTDVTEQLRSELA